MSPRGRAYYFGTYHRAGHHAWDADWNSVRYEDLKTAVPWDKIDGGLYRDAEQGKSLLHHRDGWTALAFANRTDDSRGGSNSVFFFEDTLTFDEAVAEAKRRFPNVVARFAFEITPLDLSPAGQTHGGSDG